MPGQLQLARAIPSRPGSPVGPEQNEDTILQWIEEQSVPKITLKKNQPLQL